MQSSPCLSPSGDGVIVGWRDLRFYNYQPADRVLCYAQRVASDGSIRWPANGVLVADVSKVGNKNCVTDGAGGALFCISYENTKNNLISNLTGYSSENHLIDMAAIAPAKNIK